MSLFSGRWRILGAVVVIIGGLLIGAGLARFTARKPETTAIHPPTVRATRATVATVTATVAPTTVPVTPTAAPATATVAPAATAAPAPRPAAATPTPASTIDSPAAAQNALQGAWQIDEDNLQVGTIMWSGQAVASGDGIVFTVHKVRVAGKSVTPCERQTVLRAALSMRSLQQGASYTETNCAGVSSTGEVRVSSVSPDVRSVAGSFWIAGRKLGDFRAQHL